MGGKKNDQDGESCRCICWSEGTGFLDLFVVAEVVEWKHAFRWWRESLLWLQKKSKEEDGEGEIMGALLLLGYPYKGIPT